MSEDREPPPEAIERWELSGGTWRVAHVGEDRAAVELLRCDGGEVVEVLSLRASHEVRWAELHREPSGDAPE